VADGVTTHHGTGIGVYAFFQQSMTDDNAIETPTASGVVMTHMMTFGSGINNIINGTGGASGAYSSQ
jgi:hypothetical protein